MDNYYRMYQELTLDIIIKIAFGQEKSIQDSEDKTLVEMCKSIFQPSGNIIITAFAIFSCFLHFILINKIDKSIINFAALFPELNPILRWIVGMKIIIRHHPSEKITAEVAKRIEERKEFIVSLREDRISKNFKKVWICL